MIGPVQRVWHEADSGRQVQARPEAIAQQVRPKYLDIMLPDLLSVGLVPNFCFGLKDTPRQPVPVIWFG